ncbi:MAG: Smr/MutS family protein [Acidobacteria bacterium]|nr:Smr/MutS family protein [Acidobacteriota bacterium]MBI3488080.1 Smr/MutS family protein [Acidobacteriota bacterium]
MAWKQDLAKLKQQLRPEEPAPAAKPLPKPPPKPGGPAPLAEEDAVFLSAMGLKPSASKPVQPSVAESGAAKPESKAPGAEAPAEASVPESFEAALMDLKGIKPLQKKPELSAPASKAAPPSPEPESPSPKAGPEIPAAPPEIPALKEAAPAEPSPAPAPVRFQLAAGMAIEVDGSLDLRGHSLVDALDRLKDRLGDGMVLGWRSLQVNLGTDPALHEGLLALLASGEAPMVARYAQAPVPMGGTQAWLLYFGSSSAHPATTPRREP